MQTTIVDHPLAAQALGRLRDETTDRAAFRQAMDDLADAKAIRQIIVFDEEAVS